MSVLYVDSWVELTVGCRHEGNLFARIPFLFASLVKTDVDWNYRTSYAPEFLVPLGDLLIFVWKASGNARWMGRTMAER